MAIQEETPRWFNRNVIALGIVSFLTDIHSEAILALLPQFMADVLGLRKSFIGLIEGLADITASLLKVASGWFSDRIGKRKPVVLAGYVLSTMAKPFLALAQSGWHVLAVRIADRTGKGVRTSSRDALIAESTAVSVRGRAFGFHRAMDTGGAIVGTLLAILLLHVYSGEYRLVFLVVTIAGVAAAFSVVFGVRDTARQVTDKREVNRTAELPGSLPLFLLAHTIFSAGNFSYAFFLLRAQDVGVTRALVPALYLVHNVVYAAAAYPAGVLIDRLGARTALVLAYLTHSVACLGFAFFGAPYLMPLWFVVYGIQLAATGAGARSAASTLTCVTRRGLGLGTFHACEGVGLLIASLVGGVLWDTLGSGAAPFYYGAAMALVAAIVLSYALRDTCAAGS